MTTIGYNYQNSYCFFFLILICQSGWGLNTNNPNVHKKATNWRILVVVVKWRHRAIVQLTLLILQLVYIPINLLSRNIPLQILQTDLHSLKFESLKIWSLLIHKYIAVRKLNCVFTLYIP